MKKASSDFFLTVPGGRAENAPLVPRLVKEEQELKYLGPFAAISARSRGRLREELPCSVRTLYERDKGRILYSLEFRRLRQKTQVFFDPRNDHICTRMEHVLYVNYIASTIGKALGLNTDLIEAIALGHDLGHPPFGHSGERELDLCLRRLGADFSFIHEMHSLRVVDLLAERGGKERGLNLSFEVRDGIVSHCGEKYQERQLCPQRGKTEAAMRVGAAEHAAPATLEGCVVRMADKIAYVGRDIEDATRAGLMSFDDLPVGIRSELGRDNGEIVNTLVTDIVANSWEKDEIVLSRERAESLEMLLHENLIRIYQAEKVKRYEIVARNSIQGLFEAFMNAGSDPERLAAQEDEALKNFHRYLSRHPQPDASLARRVADYIAGMTDHFANLTFTALYHC